MLKLKIKINWFWMSLLYFTFKAIAEMTPLNVRYKIRSVICSCSYFQRTAFTEIQSYTQRFFVCQKIEINVLVHDLTFNRNILLKIFLFL